MSDDDTSDDDDDVFLDLLERFPSSDEVLAAVRKHRTVRQFQIFAEKGLSALTCDEIGKALDDEFVCQYSSSIIIQTCVGKIMLGNLTHGAI